MVNDSKAIHVPLDDNEREKKNVDNSVRTVMVMH